MEERQFTPDELNKIPKDALVSMYLQTQQMLQMMAQMQKQSEEQNKALQAQVQKLQETIEVMRQQLFGKKTEKASKVMPGQIEFDPVNDKLILNEAEKSTEDGLPEEPEMETVVIRRKRTKGKRETDLEMVETTDDWHYLSEVELKELFPEGFHKLPDEIYKDLEYIPARFLVHKHHVGIYADKNKIIRGDKPYRLIQNSILTPELAAAIFNLKYVSALPLYRIEEAFRRDGVDLSRQLMAGWMIKISNEYMRPIYERFHRKLLEAKLIHCDETPFTVTEDRMKDGRNKSYMWVYHTTSEYGVPPVYLYDYREGRSLKNPAEMLKDYCGILVTDGYQVYHSLEKTNPDQFKVAGCWAHAKRKFAKLVMALKADNPNRATAAEGEKRIRAIYHMDNMMQDATWEERLKHRRESVKPLVDAYFGWIHKMLNTPIDHGSELYRALNYSNNQEKFLRAFLDDPMIPADNNAAERSIRKFCIGRNNWHICDSRAGAAASGVLYSIAETCRANGISPYLYMKYVLKEYSRCRALAEKACTEKDAYVDYEELMPWSETIQRECASKKSN